MPPRPENVPEWASGPDASIVEPPDQSKLNGWVRGVPPVAGWMNWLQYVTYNWINHLAGVASLFDDIEEAIDELSAGDVCRVFENDDSTGPHAIVEDVTTAWTATGGLERSFDTCGDVSVFGVGDVNPIRVQRDLDGAESGGSPSVTYARTSTGVISRVATDGTRVVCLYGNYLEAWNAATGASLWVFNFGAVSVADFCLKANVVYVLHNRSSASGSIVANRDIHAINAATGAVVWSYEHTGAGGARYCIACDGKRVFFSAAASSFASGANFRALRASDGADADGEGGGTGADTDGLAWNVVLGEIPQIRGMDTDGERVYIVKSAARVNQIEAYAAGDGVLVWEQPHPDGTLSAQCVSVDQDYVIVCVSDNSAPAEGYVEARNKHNGGLAWRFAVSTLSAPKTACVCAVTDGQKIFCVAEDEAKIWQITRGNEPTTYRRINPVTTAGRYRNLKLQPGGD